MGYRQSNEHTAEKVKTITLVIYGRLDGLNEYTKACRTNKFVGAKMKTDNEKLISQCIKEQIPEVKFEGQVELNFRWYEKNRRRDLDNICMAKKWVLDALVSNGIIKTDDWQGVKGFTDNFFIDKENPRIEVDIRGLDESNMDESNR